jgi:hypothetical protein
LNAGPGAGSILPLEPHPKPFCFIFCFWDRFLLPLSGLVLNSQSSCLYDSFEINVNLLLFLKNSLKYSFIKLIEVVEYSALEE